MKKTSTSNRTVKISTADFEILLILKCYMFKKKKMNLTQKSILGWTLRKAYDDFLKYEESKISQ